MDRSFFIKSLTALAGTGLLSPAVLGTQVPSDSLDYDWNLLRTHFSLPEGYRYFNSAGIGAVPVNVRQEVINYWNQSELFPAPGHKLQNWNSIKQSILPVIGAGKDESCIALTNSTTEGLNIILNGIDFKSGDEVITSTHEHPALHVPLINTAHRKGINVKTFSPDLINGLNNVQLIKGMMTKRTRLIILSLVTCTTGQLMPVKAIAEMASEREVLFALDGAQSTGSVPVNVLDWGIDFYATGGQKWLLGPKRTGFLYVRKNRLNTLTPQTVGAYSEESYNIESESLIWAQGATRFEYATQNDSLFMGLKKSIHFLRHIGLQQVYDHGSELAEYLYQGVEQINGLHNLSPHEMKYRSPIITISSDRFDFIELASKLSQKKFRVRVVGEAQVNGVRMSFHVYNDHHEVDSLLTELEEMHA